MKREAGERADEDTAGAAVVPLPLQRSWLDECWWNKINGIQYLLKDKGGVINLRL